MGFSPNMAIAPAAQQQLRALRQGRAVQQVGGVQQAFHLQGAQLVDDVLPGAVRIEGVVRVDVGIVLLLVGLFFQKP